MEWTDASDVISTRSSNVNELPFAETVNYWKTTQKSPDTIIARARGYLEEIGGSVLREAFGREGSGRAAFMLEFELSGERYKVIWPVLPSKSGNDLAARRQAATALKHDIKSRCMTLKFLGTRAAFFSYLMLSDGRTASMASNMELQDGIPQMLLIGGGEE